MTLQTAKFPWRQLHWSLACRSCADRLGVHLVKNRGSEMGIEGFGDVVVFSLCTRWGGAGRVVDPGALQLTLRLIPVTETKAC